MENTFLLKCITRPIDETLFTVTVMEDLKHLTHSAVQAQIEKVGRCFYANKDVYECYFFSSNKQIRTQCDDTTPGEY